MSRGPVDTWLSTHKDEELPAVETRTTHVHLIVGILAVQALICLAVAAFS